MDERSSMRRSSSARENRGHRTASERKTSNVSYRSKGPASTKQASSDSRQKASRYREAVNADYRPVSRKEQKQNERSARNRTQRQEHARYQSDRYQENSSRYQSSRYGENDSRYQSSRYQNNDSRYQSSRYRENDSRYQNNRYGENNSGYQHNQRQVKQEERRYQNSYRNPKKKKKKSGCGCLPSLLLLLVIAIGIYFGARQVLCAMFDKIEKYDLDFEQITVNDQDKNMDKYINIALFGVDNQDNQIYNKGSRTDCIMVASINKRSKKVKLMSIYRDTYVSIDGKYDKINAAYSYGGPELAISTINRNLDLNIQDFATVNFKALADAVDELGGITLTVKSEKERQNLNDYIGNMNKINGGNSPKFDQPDDYPFTATFDGNQAVAYSRIRYMNGGDHERANHQRLVVDGIIKEAKKKPWKLLSLINTVLPQCKTSLSSQKMWSLSRSLPRYELVDSQAYPFHSQDEKYNGIYYGFPLTTYTNTIQAHEYLFGTKDYEPTEELGKIRKKVKNVSDEIGLE